MIKTVKFFRNYVQLNKKSDFKFFENLKNAAYSKFEESRKEKRDRMFGKKKQFVIF